MSWNTWPSTVTFRKSPKWIPAAVLPATLRRGGATLPVLNASVGKEVLVRGCASRNGEKNRYAASFIKLADGTVQRLGQDVEGIFGTKIWR